MAITEPKQVNGEVKAALAGMVQEAVEGMAQDLQATTKETVVSAAKNLARDFEVSVRQVARDIINDFDVRGLQSKVLEFPGRIRLQKEGLRAGRDALADAELQLREADAFLMVGIAQETGENGKPLYSNEKAREAELIARRKIDRTYQAALKVYQEADAAVRTAQAELELLEDQFKAHRVAAELTGNTLRAIGG